MKFRLIEADSDNINLEEIEDTIYHGDDGNFYYSPDGRTSKLVPAKYQAKLKREYDNWIAQQKDLEDPDFDPEGYAKEEEERKNRIHHKLADKKTIGDLKDEWRKNVEGEKYKLDKPAKKKSRYAGMKTNPEFAEIAATLEQMAKNITTPEIVIDREIDQVWDYGLEDPMEQVDDTIRMPSWQYDPVDVEREVKNDTPYVFFYFDCSGSCCGDSFVTLGKKLVAQMKGWEEEGKLICKDLYFDTRIHDRFFYGGGTSGEAVVRDINERTENGKKIANVIIFTDNGCDDCSTYAELKGDACFIFLDYPGREIIDHVKGVHNNMFYFTSEDEIKF